MYFDSTGGATALLSNYAAAVSETIQEPWEVELSEHSLQLLSFVYSFTLSVKRFTKFIPVTLLLPSVLPSRHLALFFFC